MAQRNYNNSRPPLLVGPFRRWRAIGKLGEVQYLPERPHKRRPMKPRSGKT